MHEVAGRGSLIAVMLFYVLLASSALAAGPGPKLLVPKVSEAEKDLLLVARSVQPEAVVAFTEALATAQAVSRVRAYLAGFGVAAGAPADPDAAELKALQKRLQALRERFLILYHAHYGNKAGGHLARRLKLEGEEPVVPISEEALRLAGDPVARASARQAFVRDCYAVRRQAGVVLQAWRETLEALRQHAAKALSVSPFPARPAFADKPPAAIGPDGSTTGILIGIAGLTAHPGVAALGSDSAWGCYEPYDRGYELSPMVEAAWYGRKSQIIVPCAVHDRMFTPADWYNKHSDLPISRPGAPKRYTGSWFWPLDFYHPAVREMLKGYLTETGTHYKGNPNVLLFTTAWEAELTDRAGYERKFDWGQWPTGGRSPAGKAAFRKYLSEKFDSIERLNAAWGATYDGFDAIEPPADLIVGPEPQRKQLIETLYEGRPTPLYCEFNRFLKQSYADYLAWCYRVLKAADPTHPIAVSPSYGSLDGYLCMGRDSFRWASDTCDLFGSEMSDSLEEVYTYSVSRATGRTTGIFECVWNAPSNRSFPPEAQVRAAARRNLWRMVAWGRRVFSLYGARDTYGGTANNNMMVLESGYNLVRLGAGIIPVVRRKLRAAEDVWLEAPVVEPRIAMLRPTTSQLCAWPWPVVTTTCRKLHDLMYPRHYHYAFVPEEYLLSGRESLDRYRALLLPFATQLPAGLADRILPWVRSGGTLIIAGVAGAFTPYGKADGQLMKELFGQVECTRTGDLAWQLSVPKPRAGVSKVGSALLAVYGKGQALLAPNVDDVNADGPVGRRLLELIARAAPRGVWSSGDAVEVVVRKNEERTYVVVLNPSETQAARTTVHLAGAYRLAVDRGIERGFPVPLRKEQAGQAFDITLAPGEGTVIELTQLQEEKGQEKKAGVDL